MAKKIEEEDDAAIRSRYKGLIDKYVKIICDEDIEDDQGDFGPGSSSADIKRRKITFTIGPGKPTDSLTKASLLDSSDTQAGGSKPLNARNSLFKSSSVTVTVREKSDTVSTSGLLSLGQQYGSSDDE
ncbi:hypothetical protein LIER_23982 [Lithospermum erythrorhizon]|uniref:Uncharacterized protein n=1 Tax=Lithospermum erythrorhizon TaxID=34254 RepID=A0AAV3R2J0_LITER